MWSIVDAGIRNFRELFFASEKGIGAIETFRVPDVVPVLFESLERNGSHGGLFHQPRNEVAGRIAFSSICEVDTEQVLDVRREEIDGDGREEALRGFWLLPEAGYVPLGVYFYFVITRLTGGFVTPLADQQGDLTVL